MSELERTRKTSEAEQLEDLRDELAARNRELDNAYKRIAALEYLQCNDQLVIGSLKEELERRAKR